MAAGWSTLRRWWRRPAIRRAIIALGVVLGLAVVAVIAYPRVGAWYVRSRAVPRLAERYGATVTIGAVDVAYGHATLRDVRVAARGDAPAIVLARVEVDFDGMASLLGRGELERVVVRGGAIEVVRYADGTTNLERFRAPPRTGRGGGPSTPVSFHDLTVRLRDEGSGTTGAATVSGRRGGGRVDATLTGVTVQTVEGPALAAAAIDVERADGKLAATVDGGEVQIWQGLALTGITGTVAEAATPGQLAVRLTGGYGGVAGTLWTAAGWVEPAAAAGEVRVKADAFSLEKLRPILEGRRELVDYPRTVVDADLVLARRGDAMTLRGAFHVADLTLAHPMIADEPVAIESLSGDVEASYDRGTRTLTLGRAELLGTRGLPFSITGDAVIGPRLRPARLSGRLVVPAVACQQVLTALPNQLTAELRGFELTGMFSTDLRVAIDWANLDATALGGSVGIRGCRARRVAKNLERLRDSFEHWVEVGADEWLSFEVGPGNPDFVPIAEVSPYLLTSLQTTEDGSFYRHHGFIPSEFRTALVRNLKAGGFRYGASSITMQMVKNVLLYRKKTLARKFQELFLTWAVENYLDKDRIFEIYINAIEYGPALYGIGPAAREYFGKPAADITLREAAFFSSILPNPKERYKQYCKGELRRWTEDKIARILTRMLDKGRVTREEYDAAMAEPLVFVKVGTETEAQCLRRVEQALKKARPTNPMVTPR